MKVLELPQPHDFRVGPGAVHVLPTHKFLWRTHADKRDTTLSKVDPGKRTAKAIGPPPALHLFGIGPGLPYSFDGRVKDTFKNEVPLPSAPKCLVVGHFLVIHYWYYFIACLIQSIMWKLLRF